MSERVNYTEVRFASAEARRKYAEACVELRAREVVEASRSNDLGRLSEALDDLCAEVEELDRAWVGERSERARRALTK